MPLIREKDAVAMLFTGRRYGNSWYGFWSKSTKKGLEAGQKGVPEAKWALDEYKSSGKMIFMVRGPRPGLPLSSHLRLNVTKTCFRSDFHTAIGEEGAKCDF